MNPIDQILQGLTRVRQRQPNQYSACCPAHDDTGPSLSVRETPDGSVLLHCFAGCTPEEITGALGLDMADLFPPRETPPNAPRRVPRLLTSGQALELLAVESNFIAIAAGNIGNGVELTQDDIDRARLSAGRVQWMRDQVIGGHPQDCHPAVWERDRGGRVDASRTAA